ncbi:uncharacterized protein LOC113290880 [Papaver somniferum]|uniref:uncharacterized protein LOC113290880 n=1 Tax=Papaver somniferum TaxID=3469 RepID=UPI000E6F77F0|nr:uncharacterized protein LOC113290880 [Papaver somniferum]
MNDKATDGKLCLKEFPKSLTGTTFTWYDNLKEESVDSWQTMSALFLGKFYSAKRKITAIDLSKSGQRISEEVGKYISRFRRLTLYCHEEINEEALVEICIQGMAPAFRGSLINFRFQTFVELEEAAERIADCIKEAPIDSVWRTTVSTASGTPRNVRPNISKENKDQPPIDGRSRGRNRGSRRDYKTPPLIPCDKERAIRFLNQWISEGEIQLPPTTVDINKMDKNSAKYFHYHRRMGHPTEECFSIRSIFERKRAAGELETTRQTITYDPFPRH